jgi:nucleoside-diphosphate-sugar epimerase
MRMLVTRGLGYIGRAVTIRLAEAGHKVAILTRSRPDPPADPSAHAELLYGDLRDRDRIFDLVASDSRESVTSPPAPRPRVLRRPGRLLRRQP